MRSRLILLAFLAGVLWIFQSCSKATVQLPVDTSRLMRIEDVLQGDDHQLLDLLNIVRGSVGKRGPGSKTIWSTKNDFGLGLYVSANHVYGLNSWRTRSAEYFDLATVNPGIFETSQIPPENGYSELGTTLTADFPLMHFDISVSATNTTILPSEDFYLGIVDNQRVKQGMFPQYPVLVQTNAPLQMYDPGNRSKADQTWNEPIKGERAILVGYPQDVVNYPNGAVAYGKILSDKEAESILTQLRSAGDSEGDIPYNSLIEFIVEAPGIAGMSGGGVFNSTGQLLGIMVRGSEVENVPRIIRAVKVSHINSKLKKFYSSLPQADKDKIRSYVSGEL
ncbi:serine protease [Salmonirosea aquatica]|uniref:Serine protease n=1 Tax=Salmonirosea aquatica TaxID=2654236 RepID=A0A7C9BW21_9BACT|nr:hypothetical protein [Cytophagaceae bacterium SJW1-29]